jgi:hypothetical protein
MTAPKVLISIRLRARVMKIVRDMARENDAAITEVIETLIVEALRARKINVDLSSKPSIEKPLH